MCSARSLVSAGLSYVAPPGNSVNIATVEDNSHWTRTRRPHISSTRRRQETLVFVICTDPVYCVARSTRGIPVTWSQRAMFTTISTLDHVIRVLALWVNSLVINKIYFKTRIISEEIVRSVNEKWLNFIEVALVSVKRQQVIMIILSDGRWTVDGYVIITVYVNPSHSSPWNIACYIMITVDRLSPSMINHMEWWPLMCLWYGLFTLPDSDTDSDCKPNG